jgi:ATP-binding cassette subfamily B protein
VQREAFVRARRFLNYNPVAKWTALGCAVATGVVYVGLLIVFGLFVDLVISRGIIPSFHSLSLPEQEQFLQGWTQVPAEVRDSWRRLLPLALEREELRKKTDDASVEQLRELERRLADLKVDVDARDRERVASLESIHVDELMEIRLLAADVAQLTKRDPERIWRAHLYHLLDHSVSDQAAEQVTGTPLDQELADQGILTLVVRSQSRPYGPLVNWFARWNPWSWRSRDPSWPNNYSYLGGLLLLALGLALVRALLHFVGITMAARATVEAATRIRRAVYHHTFRLGNLAVRALGPSEAVGIVTRELEAVSNALYDWLTVVFREPVKLAFLLAFVLLVNFWLSLAFALFALVVWLVGGQVAAYYRRQGRLATQVAAEQLALIQESMMMMRLVKVYLMELFNQSRVERQLARYSRAQLLRHFGEAIYRPLLVFLGTFATIMVLGATALMVFSYYVGVANVITLATALVSMYFPIFTWLEHRWRMRRGRESAVTLFSFLDRRGDVGQVVGAEFLQPLAKHLEFDDVSLREPGTDRMLLRHVSFTIQAGQRVGLVGQDDLEKHALVYLIPRFLDPTSGEIRIDDHNLRWVTLDSLRAQIAIVLQHNLVFNDTVANNIGCSDPSFTLPQIIEAAKVAHAHQFVQKLPQGYETPIGEMGHVLDAGQQFFIALARAILRDPAVFIIEEPEVLMDDDVKALLDDTFARVLPGRTAIFLPHRASTIRSCDRILLLHRGQIEAAGEHRELLTQNELYRHLHYLEFSEMAEQV